jgi:hypothetical protein
VKTLKCIQKVDTDTNDSTVVRKLRDSEQPQVGDRTVYDLYGVCTKMSVSYVIQRNLVYIERGMFGYWLAILTTPPNTPNITL